MSGRRLLIVGWRELLMATPQLSATDLAVGQALASFMNARSGECWPSVETIAGKAHCHPATARRSLRTLERLELIETEPGGGRHRSNHYRINASAARGFLAQNPSAEYRNPSGTLAEGVQEGAIPPSIPPTGGRKKRGGARRGARPANLAGAHVKPDGAPDLDYLAADTA